MVSSPGCSCNMYTCATSSFIGFITLLRGQPGGTAHSFTTVLRVPHGIHSCIHCTVLPNTFSQVSIQTPCCKRWYECSECHDEHEGHPQRIGTVVVRFRHTRNVSIDHDPAYPSKHDRCRFCELHRRTSEKRPLLESTIISCHATTVLYSVMIIHAQEIIIPHDGVLNLGLGYIVLSRERTGRGVHLRQLYRIYPTVTKESIVCQSPKVLITPLPRY